MFNRTFLKKVWIRARRRRVLYSALNGEDRTYFWVTMEVMKINDLDELCSAEVGTIIVKILAKLKEAMKSPFARKIETYGFMKARQLSRVAVEWGYTTAQRWANETGYIRHLTNNELNTSPGWGV